MGIIDVQWKANGAPYTTFEVDFSNRNTDWRIDNQSVIGVSGR